MRKFSVLILAILLLAIVFSFTSCEGGLDGLLDYVVVGVLGEDDPFAQQMIDFEFFMMCKSYFVKIGDVFVEIGSVFAAADYGSWLGIGKLLLVLVTNFLGWLAAIVIYLLAASYLLFVDVFWTCMLLVLFILLCVILLGSNLLGFIFGLFV